MYLPLAMFAILLTASRTATVCGVFALTVVFWTSSQLRPVTRIMALVPLAVLGFVGVRLVPAGSLARIATLGSKIHDLNNRVDIWRAGSQILQEHPWAGIGAGAFPTGVERITGSPLAAHNSFLAIGVEQGIVGLLLFVSIPAALFVSAWKLPRGDRLFCAVILITWAIGASVLTWDYRKPTWLVFALIALRVYHTTRETRGTRPAGRRAAPVRAGRPPIVARAPARGLR
jgi:O-antigen ligase